MADKHSEGDGSSLLNFNSILALLTVVGGAWLVSHKLTSERPVAPGGGTQTFLGEQTLEARLWEDPLKDSERFVPKNAPDIWGETNRNILKEQIVERQKQNEVLLLPVMLSGGHYSEDQESRIRSRFAIGSALNASGYAPEDAEHIGELTIRWPTAHELDLVKEAQTNCHPKDLAWPRLLEEHPNLQSRMDLRYEWYQERYPGGHDTGSKTNVLVLWLDDSFFEDEPLLRLALLLEPLVLTNQLGKRLPVKLIGPRRSSTLLAMLAQEDGQGKACFGMSTTNVLRNVSLFCATPSAMDEVFVDHPEGPPRTSVWRKLTTNVFNSYYNFATTDSQLACEVMQELALRRVDLTDKQKHLVLIAESDTFYARVLSLTYAAELAVRQTNASDRADFVYSYISGTNGAKTMPTNFHAFSYFRGLDGQTVGNENGVKGSKSDNENTKARLTSVEELRNWSPDANKAEGQPQFDYLARLGEQLRRLEESLHREESGHIEAIGIVGSDVYDTLLILQALRHQFPEALFFTTDLDARFCHPHERDWARNLIVVSGYGLRLHPGLQGETAPFRDSTQTAQFAAALAALGNTSLMTAGRAAIPPRRFEIGNRAAVDLSTSNLLLASTNLWLHPSLLADTYRAHPHHAKEHLYWCLAIAAILVLALCVYWDPLRQLTLEAFSFPLEVLDYTEEDMGGPDGAEVLLTGLEKEAGDPLGHWLLSHELVKACRSRPATKQGATPEEIEQLLEEWRYKLAGAFVALFNLLLKRVTEDAPITKLASSTTNLVPATIKAKAKLWRVASCNPVRRVGERRAARRYLDAVLNTILDGALKTSLPGTHQAITIKTAAEAREAARIISRLRWTRLICFWLGLLGFAFMAVRLGFAIWENTFKQSDGELFSLTSGTSAWPAEILRLLVFACATGLCFGLYLRMRECFLSLTRRYRLTFHDGAPLPSGNQVSAPTLWHKYWHDGVHWRRVRRIVLVLPFYLLLLFATTEVFDQSPFNFVRGPAARAWDRFLVCGAAISFIVLAFLTVDAARLCRGFILRLSGKCTAYPEPTLRHFSRQLGNIAQGYLDEWIDLHLISELTERVGRLVYYPAGLLFLLLIARNTWWDCWSWPVALVVIFVLNFGLAVASLLILQFAARRAKQLAEQNLTKKLKQARARTAPSVEANDANQAEELLEEIRNLRRGAFVPFWENPVVSAIFVPSGGMTILQIFIWFMGR